MEGSREDGNSLVRVCAQVMTRDDSTGLWVPMGAGGLSHVSVCKGSVSSETDNIEYLIYGRRIVDKTVVLSCSIKRDFQYNKVMPTFHHWSSGDKKFGLAFQTAADARAFDKGVRMAIQDLSDDVGDFPNFRDSDQGEDDVFMAVDIPMESMSSSGSSSFSGGRTPHHYTADPTSSSPPFITHHHPHRHQLSFTRTPHLHNTGNNNVNGYVPDPTQSIDKIEICHGGDLNTYVQLSREGKGYRTEYDYSYPVVDPCKPAKKMDLFNTQPPPKLPVKAKKKRDWRKDNRKGVKNQCRFCQEMYSPEDNEYCEDAPDRVRECIKGASCLSCAKCVLYHCVSDAEGDTPQDSPKRWTVLALLSLIMPCLWCYLPCRACHKCGVRCGVCGGRHDPA